MSEVPASRTTSMGAARLATERGPSGPAPCAESGHG
jgi:hypothetical protein